MAEKNGRRREKGEGSLYPRKNKQGKVIGWIGAYTVPAESGTGRRKVYAKARKEAKALLAAALAEMTSATGSFPGDGGTSVGEYLGSWLRESEASLKVSSYRRYEHSVRYHLAPVIGRFRLSKLTPSQVQGLYREKLQGGLSARSVIHLHEALRRAMNRAVRLGLVPRNPCDAVEPPRAAKSAMRPLDRKQSATFLESASGTRFEALFVLAVTTGMRQGEMLGLRWSDLDLPESRLRVSRSFVAWGGRGRGPSFVEPKTGTSRRVVSLTRKSVTALEGQVVTMREAGLYGADRPVFSGSGGMPVAPQNVVNRYFKPLLKNAGLPDVRFHDLRHTCATLLLGEGVHPKIVQELLGHSSVQITLDTYSHYLPDMQAGAVEAMERALDVSNGATEDEPKKRSAGESEEREP